MNKYFKLKVFSFIAILLIVSSCSKMDSTFYEFIKDGEKVYAGKPESLETFAGLNRVKLLWLLKTDPMITSCRVYWFKDGLLDSLDVSVERTDEVDTVEVIIDNLPEDSYNFIIYAYDSEGNSSVASEVIGYSYGENYQNSLHHRLIKDVDLSPDGKRLTLEWYPVLDAIGTQLKYQDLNGREQVLDLPNDVDELTMDDIDISIPFTYQSFYLPEEKAIDTFSNDPAIVEIIPPASQLATSHFEANYQYGEIMDGDKEVFDFTTYSGFTVQLRFKSDGLQHGTAMITNKDWRSGNNPGWIISPNGSKWSFNCGGDRRIDLTSSGPDIDDGNWHVLAVTINKEINELQMFQDGVLVGSLDDISGLTWTTTSIKRLIVGDDLTGEGRVRVGNGSVFSLADIKIWDVALDESAMVEMGKSCDTDFAPEGYRENLIGWWLGLEGEGDSLEDLSGRGNHVQLTEQAANNWKNHTIDLCNEEIGTKFIIK